MAKTKYGLTINELKTTLKSVAQPYKGSTKIGHALSKHAGRQGGEKIWGKIEGASKIWHDQAMKHFRKIIRDTGQFQTVTDSKTGLSWIEKKSSDNRRAVRLNLDHTFKGFID